MGSICSCQLTALKAESIGTTCETASHLCIIAHHSSWRGYIYCLLRAMAWQCHQRLRDCVLYLAISPKEGNFKVSDGI